MTKKITIAALMIVFGSGFAMAEAAKSGMPMAMKELSKEERAKMAAAHEKMAVCLRSEKPLAECRDEMRNSCQESMGKESCPMGDMGQGMGMMHKGVHRKH